MFRWYRHVNEEQQFLEFHGGDRYLVPERADENAVRHQFRVHTGAGKTILCHTAPPPIFHGINEGVCVIGRFHAQAFHSICFKSSPSPIVSMPRIKSSTGTVR